jgi:hypothetical protein
MTKSLEEKLVQLTIAVEINSQHLRDASERTSEASFLLRELEKRVAELEKGKG